MFISGKFRKTLWWRSVWLTDYDNENPRRQHQITIKGPVLLKDSGNNFSTHYCEPGMSLNWRKVTVTAVSVGFGWTGRDVMVQPGRNRRNGIVRCNKC